MKKIRIRQWNESSWLQVSQRLKQKKDAEASSFQCSGNRTRMGVRRGGYEPEILLNSMKQKRMPKHPLSM